MRRVLGMLFGLVALLLVAVSGYWYWAELRLGAGFREWEAARRAEGWQVGTTRDARGGWPFAASLDLGVLSVALPSGPAWRSEATTLDVRLTQPQALTVRLGGTQRVALPGLPPVELRGTGLQASMPLAQRPGRSSVDLAGTKLVAVAAGMPVALGALGLDVTMRDGAGRKAAAVSFHLATSSIDLPDSVAWPLGDHLDRLDMQGALSGPIVAAPSVRQRARAWQAAGGALLLQQVDGVWGPLAWSASARVSLDSQLQPVASVTTRLTGQDAALQKMQADGLIGSGTATAARAVLGLVAQHAEDEPARVELPMTLSDGLLYVGGIPLVRVPRIDWSASG